MTVSLAAVCTLLGGMALTAVVSAGPALADYEPGSNDVVGVGSDTLQYMLDFGAGGDTNGDLGYNNSAYYKLDSMDATADANGRFSWAVGATLASPTAGALNPTDVLRGGTYPQQRINGSGAGISALLADTSVLDPTINFVRMSSNPTASEGAVAAANGWQGLQDFVLGTDTLQEAADLTNNIPCGTATGACPATTGGLQSNNLVTAGLSAVELGHIYEANTPNCYAWPGLWALAGSSATATASTTLSAAITSATATSISVSSTTGFPATLPFSVAISNGTASGWEAATVTAESGDTLTVTRGVYGTTAQTAASGATVSLIPTGISTDTIIPIIPQSGAGIRSTFLADLSTALGTTVNAGTCTTIGESNDPTAITSLATNSSGNPLTVNPVDGSTCSPNCAYDAIEPFSGARLDLWNGVVGNSSYGSNVGAANAYFRNPADPYPNTKADVETPGIEQLANTTTLSAAITSSATSLTVASDAGFPTTAPFTVTIGTEDLTVTAVSGTTWTVTRGANGTTAAAQAAGATVSLVDTVDNTPTYTDHRDLYVVYRWTDQISSTDWQPGSATNWAETLFCNPGGSFTPFFQTGPGQVLLSEAGDDPSTQTCLSSPFS
jgi:hypothetical protein